MAKDYYALTWTPPANILTEADRLRYWGLVVELGLKRKDLELSKGLNKYGTKLPRVRPATRKRRRSAMTPDGRGDPNAPYLTPGHELSRVRSLLAGRAYKDRAIFYWRFDPNSPNGSFFEILNYHRKRGKRYDVIGLSPSGVAWVKREADKRWAKQTTQPPANEIENPLPILKSGKQTTKYIDIATDTTKEELEKAIREGRFSGWRTAAELDKLLRQSVNTTNTVVRNTATTNVPVNRGVNNTVLNYTFRTSSQPPANTTIWQSVKGWWRQFKVKFGI